MADLFGVGSSALLSGFAFRRDRHFEKRAFRRALNNLAVFVF